MYLRVIEQRASAEAETIARARYGLGYAYFNLKDYEPALFNFKEFTTKFRKSGGMQRDALVRLADCYYVSKSYQDAIKSYNEARKLGSPDDDYIVFQMGMVMGILRNYDDARRHFNILIANYPKSQYRDEGMFQAAQFEIEQGNYQAAVNGLTRLINEGSASPFLPSAYLRRATSYYNLKQYDKTVSDYETVIKKFNSHPAAKEALLPLQEALNLTNRSGEFDAHLETYKKANPESKDLEVVEFEAAKGMYFNQQYQRAITGLSSFVTSYPNSARVPEARYYLAESHYRQRDLDKALQIYVDLSGDPSFTFYTRVINRVAEVEFRQGLYERAVVSFHRVEKIAGSKRDLYNAWSGLMESYYLLAKYDSVDTYANLIIERGNVNAGATNKATLYLGKSAMARGDFDSAKDEFLNTLNTARDEYGAEAKYLLGEIFYQTKDYNQCYETLLSLIADFAAYDEWVGKAFLLLADNYVAQNDIFNAKATLQSLINNKFPLEHIVNMAKDKLKKLEEEQKKAEQNAVQADTTQNDN
jgi:TolA-binding protein